MSLRNQCPERETVFRCLHRLLDPAEETAVRRHLSECAACREVAAGYERLDAALGDWKALEPSPAFDARLREKIEERARPSFLRTLFTQPVTRAFAAAVVLIVMVAGTFVLHHLRTTTAPGTVPGAVQVAKNAPPAPVQKAATVKLSAEEKLKMYENLPVLENYDMLANFDVLSELAPEKKND